MEKRNEEKKDDVKCVTFSCDSCTKVFTLKKNLNAHKKKYHGAHQIKYGCNECPATRTSCYDLKYHLKNEHGIVWDVKEIERMLAFAGRGSSSKFESKNGPYTIFIFSFS